jgi:hypothetical protein
MFEVTENDHLLGVFFFDERQKVLWLFKLTYMIDLIFYMLSFCLVLTHIALDGVRTKRVGDVEHFKI